MCLLQWMYFFLSDLFQHLQSKITVLQIAKDNIFALTSRWFFPVLTLSGPSFQINVRSSGGGGNIARLGFVLFWPSYGLTIRTSYIKYDLLYMLCRPHSNIWNHARADRHTNASDIKLPVKYGQNAARKLHVGQNAPTFFSFPKIVSITKFKYI